MWFRYKDASLGKRGKMKRSAFEHTLYTLRHLAEGEPAPRGGAGAACGGAGAPHGGPLGGEYFDDGADDGAGGGGPGTEAPSLKETIAGKMMKKWLLSVLKPFTSVTVRDADAPLGQRAMQILRLQRTGSVGKSWETWSSPDHRLTVRVARAIGAGGVRNGIHGRLTSLRCMATKEGPSHLPFWDTSEPQGCKVGTLGRQFPTLGWEGTVARRAWVRHEKDSPKEFDCRALM